MRYNEGALLFTVRALNRCLRSLPAQTEAVCKHEFASRGPRLFMRLQALLTAQPDPARPYGSAGFLGTLNKLLPTLDETMRMFVGAASTTPNAAADTAQERQPVLETDRPQEETELQSSSDDDSDL